MHSPDGVDPINPISIEKKKISGKRTKTEADYLELYRLDYLQAIYHCDKVREAEGLSDDKVGPYISARMIEACMREAAKKQRKGKVVVSGVMVGPDDYLPLQYNGPESIEELFTDPSRRFISISPVTIKGSRIMACRPKFREWGLDFEVIYDDEQLNRLDIRTILDTAGKLIGIGAWRPQHGQFTVTDFQDLD